MLYNQGVGRGDQQPQQTTRRDVSRAESAAKVEQVLTRLPEGCQRLFAEEAQAFAIAPGSSYNHQNWDGGWMDHTAELFRISESVYSSLSQMRPLPFSIEEAQLVLFVHDLEKPFKYFTSSNHPDWQQQAATDSEAFKQMLIERYHIPMSEQQQNALRYIHGEGDDYRKDERVASRLAAFCHTIDYLSARLWFDYPNR